MASRTALRLARHTPLTSLSSAAAPVSVSARFASTTAKGKARAKATSTASSSTTSAPAAPPQTNREVLGNKEDPYAVPPLSRPLGSPIEPSTDKMTWQKRREQLLDQDRRKAERKALIKEASQGYFHDYNLARRANGGKLFVGPPVLIREDAALYFPNITGKALTNAEVNTTDLFKGKVSLVTILNTRISEEHVQSFVEPVLEDWEGQPIFNYVQINHQDNKLKSLLVSFMTSGLKRTIPEERWGTYMISTGEWSPLDITGPLGMENKLLGYVFLVDENAKVRWAGCGTAQPKEVEDLRRAAAVLIRRKIGDKAVAGTK